MQLCVAFPAGLTIDVETGLEAELDPEREFEVRLLDFSGGHFKTLSGWALPIANAALKERHFCHACGREVPAAHFLECSGEPGIVSGSDVVPPPR